MENKRYWLFQYDQYYPQGGMEDLTGTYDTLEEVQQQSNQYWQDSGYYYHILDTDTMMIVEKKYKGYREKDNEEEYNLTIEQLKDQ